MGKIASITVINGPAKSGKTAVAMGLAATVPKAFVIDEGRFGQREHQKMLKKDERPTPAFALQMAEFFNGANVVIVITGKDDPFLNHFITATPGVTLTNIKILTGISGSTNGEATNQAASIEAEPKAHQRRGKRPAKAV